jgi:hypothetical protein
MQKHELIEAVKNAVPGVTASKVSKTLANVGLSDRAAFTEADVQAVIDSLQNKPTPNHRNTPTAVGSQLTIGSSGLSKELAQVLPNQLKAEVRDFGIAVHAATDEAADTMVQMLDAIPALLIAKVERKRKDCNSQQAEEDETNTIDLDEGEEDEEAPAAMAGVLEDFFGDWFGSRSLPTEVESEPIELAVDGLASFRF